MGTVSEVSKSEAPATKRVLLRASTDLASRPAGPLTRGRYQRTSPRPHQGQAEAAGLRRSHVYSGRPAARDLP